MRAVLASIALSLVFAPEAQSKCQYIKEELSQIFAVMKARQAKYQSSEDSEMCGHLKSIDEVNSEYLQKLTELIACTGPNQYLWESYDLQAVNMAEHVELTKQACSE